MHIFALESAEQLNLFHKILLMDFVQFQMSGPINNEISSFVDMRCKTCKQAEQANKGLEP